MGLMSAGGGGLTNSKLALATAEPEDVISGKTFYAGGKEMKTGTIRDMASVVDFVNFSKNANGNCYVRINEGAYRTSSVAGYPEIKLPSATVAETIIKATLISNYSDNGGTDSSTHLVKDISLAKGNIYLIILDVGTRDGKGITASLDTPNCTNLINLSYSDTQDKAYYDSRLIVRLVKCNANTTATAKLWADNIRSAGRIICYRIAP